MRLFVLAAGTGSRLMPLTRHTPKSLLDLGNGSSLLDRQIELAMALPELAELCVVTGYRSAQVEERLHNYRDTITARSVFNPFYRSTNNLISVWCVNELMQDDDFAITNGDNLYDVLAVTELLAEKRNEGIYLTISRKDDYDDDDMKVAFGDGDRVMQVSKEIPVSGTDAESVGLVIVRGQRMRELFSQCVVDLVKDPAFHQCFWLEIINRLVHDGVYVKAVEIASSAWDEFDFHPDIETIRAEMARRMKDAILS